ncbi:class I SAM-dependent methyltransferase [Geobacillus sp. 47C-IIb]|uniref:class I SAM-dependent methyltransferase n=1 Tax=Geobacillus sp. 47C-IIb TaxID=1963026 RepID=UPI001CC20071|nr:class I SAM-dependent methyltransferase [Geobacillus sp. 47C-IIb]
MEIRADGVHNIHLENEKETLLITLYAKALDYHSKHSILNDKKSAELVNAIDYDFEKLNRFPNGNLMVVRAKQFDTWLADFLQIHPNATVLNLGCGLDTRVSRINPSSNVSWFDVDYPEVIKIRKQFYSNRDGYEMIASSVTEEGWLEKIPSDKPVMIIAEGLLEYFTVECKLSLYFGTKEPFFCTFLQKALSPFLKECAKFFVNYFGRENPSVHRRGRRT